MGPLGRARGRAVGRRSSRVIVLPFCSLAIGVVVDRDVRIPISGLVSIQQRNTSSKRKKMERCGFQPNSR